MIFVCINRSMNIDWKYQLFPVILHIIKIIMTSEEYKKALLDPRWIKLRAEIVKRDKYTCRKCKKTNCLLHVHHKYYLKDKMPWEVPTRWLISLCEECHTKEHENKLIKSFTRDPSIYKDNMSTLNKKRKNKKRKQSKPKVWVEGKGLIDAP